MEMEKKREKMGDKNKEAEEEESERKGKQRLHSSLAYYSLSCETDIPGPHPVGRRD